MLKKAFVSIKDFFKTLFSAVLFGGHGVALILVLLIVLTLVFRDEMGAWITLLYEKIR